MAMDDKNKSTPNPHNSAECEGRDQKPDATIRPNKPNTSNKISDLKAGTTRFVEYLKNLYLHDEARTEAAGQRRLWSFDRDGALFRLVSEAHRTGFPHLFDSILLVHPTLVEPLPHTITAVDDTNVATCGRVRLYAAEVQKGHDQNIWNGFAQ